MKRKVFSVVCLVLAIVLTVSLVACNKDDIKFSVTADYDAEQGSVAISDAGGNDKAEFKAGEKAFVKVTPKRGYSIDTFTVNDEAAQPENGEYSFDVRKNTVVKVTFEKKDLVPLSQAALNSVKTTLKIDGVYVYQIEGGATDVNNVTTVFGTNAVNIYETSPDGDVNYDDVYVNIDGKIAMPYHTLKNELKYQYPTTADDYAEYDNPFKTLSLSDFAMTAEYNVFELIDADEEDDVDVKRIAATAITGYYESIESFKITVDDDKVTGIEIVTARIKRSDGVGGEFYYTTVYSLGVSDWGTAEVDPEKTTAYVKEDAHDLLSAALAAAYRAKNYTIKINEKALSAQDEDLEYYDYVTEQAIYYDSEGWEEGYVEIGEDAKTVYPFDYDPETGVVTLRDPNKNFPTIRSMRAGFNSTGDFAPEIFSYVENADGSITFALRDGMKDDSYNNVREILLNFADGLDIISLYLYYTYEVTITIKDGALYQVELLWSVSDALVYRTMTYMNFDNTELPITFDNCVRESVLDDFIGTYTDGNITAVIDRENGIVINGKNFIVDYYDVWSSMFTGEWDGGEWGLARLNAKQLILLSDEDDTSYVLTSTAIDPVSIPSDYTGVWSKDSFTVAIAYDKIEYNGVMLKVLSYDEVDGLYAINGDYTYNLRARELQSGKRVIWLTISYEGLSNTTHVLDKDESISLIPEQFVGTWEIDDYLYGYHKAVVGLTTVALEVKGQKPTATVVSVEKESGLWQVVLNVSGFVVKNGGENGEDLIINDLEFSIKPYFSGNERIFLYCTDYIWGTEYSVTLDKSESIDVQPTVPEHYFGTYSGSDDNDVEYLIVIDADGITVTIDGTAYTATVVDFEEDYGYELITISINGNLYYVMPNVDDETAIDFFDNDDTIEVTLELVGGNVSIPNKFCGTFTGSNDGVAYVVTISTSGVTVSVDGVDKQITSIKFDATEDYITVKFDGIVYTIIDSSYTDPINKIMLYSFDYSVMVNLNREA